MKTARIFNAFALFCAAAFSLATPEFVEHLSGTQVFGEPTGTTMREPEFPRENESTDVYFKIGYSFFYTNVALYYTTDGSTPGGVRGVPTGTTQVITPTFLRNQGSSGGNQDWWKATLPASTRARGVTTKYRFSAWHSAGGLEVFANNYGCAGNGCSNTPATFQYTNKIAWPGAGAGSALNAAIGYPAVLHWKEEAMTGNNYTSAMIDQNGTLYDIYFPSPGTVNGVGTKNEGYVGGTDTFPPGLPAGNRGQAHVNQAMAGIRIDGLTYWMSNEGGVGYEQVSQSYVTDTNVVQGSMRLKNYDVKVDQYDFNPAGITFPQDLGFNPQRGIYVKRYVLTNVGTAPRSFDFYYYSDWAINGGDNFDQMFFDNTRKAMVAYDNTLRNASSVGEYNPTTFSGYTKDVSIYFGTALKVMNSSGATINTATDSWRDSSSDNGQGWIATPITLAPGEVKEVNVVIAGGFDNFANATGTYSYQIAPVIDWFYNNSMASVQTATENYWKNWLAQGTTFSTTDPVYTKLFQRGLLGTMIHFDAKNGGVVAGYHNGAYPFVWPRDAAYAAVTLARTGHTFESSEVYRFLREVTYRANETWGGKGFWYQKYTNDGYIIWSAPQVDETAVVPWGVRYHYDVTGDNAFLSQNWSMVRDAGFASSQSSTIDSRLFYDSANNLINSMNVWEDSFDAHIYSNANVVRGLWDAAAIGNRLGHTGDANTFNTRANTILGGVNGRLDWNGENTDISQLGLVYPFNVLPADNLKVKKVVDRINGVATDRNGANKPLVNFSGEWEGLINRYWGDGYWNGGPWFLSTMWYGLYYAERADVTPGLGDINTHKSKLDLLLPHIGPAGFGAEQIAPINSRLYPNFTLQTAWPNAWESMSTFVDSMMAFLDYTPDAPNNILKIAPKLPSSWPSMKFSNVKMGAHRFDIEVLRNGGKNTVVVKNLTGQPARFSVWLKLPVGSGIQGAAVNRVPVRTAYEAAGHRIEVRGTLKAGVGAITQIESAGK